MSGNQEEEDDDLELLSMERVMESQLNNHLSAVELAIGIPQPFTEAAPQVIVGVPVGEPFDPATRRPPSASAVPPASRPGQHRLNLTMSLWSTHGEINLDSSEICGDSDAASATAAIASSELGSRLKILGMSGCSISAVPPALCRLQALEVLGLNVNRITELPVTLGQCTSLK